LGWSSVWPLLLIEPAVPDLPEPGSDLGREALLDQQIGSIVLGVVPEMFDAIPFLLVVAALLGAEERHAEEQLNLGSPDSA
jgi:hypothetical protein